MTTPNQFHRKRESKMFVIVPVALLGLFSVIPFGGNAPLIATLLGQAKASPQLTIVAKADNTFDIKEFPKADQWFAPDVVGEALKVTAQERLGKNIAPETVNILVTADPGAKDEVIRAALQSARASGFVRFGFADPRLSQLAQQVGASPVATIHAAQ